MSWVEGLKRIEFLGFKYASIEITKKDIQSWGCFFPLMINHKQIFEAVVGNGSMKLRDIIGSGNTDDYNYLMEDFHFYSTIWPNFFEAYDDALLGYNEDKPLSMILGWGVLRTIVENPFTSEETIRNNIISVVVMPEKEDVTINYWLGGLYSPVQDEIVSNFNFINRDSLFHESIHAIKRAVEDDLRFMMYGGESQQEEIMTHLFTDKFNSFQNLNKFLKDTVVVEVDSIGKWKSPTSISFKKSADKKNSQDGTVATQATIVKGYKTFKSSEVLNHDFIKRGRQALENLRSIGNKKITENQNNHNKQSVSSVVRKELEDLVLKAGIVRKSVALASYSHQSISSGDVNGMFTHIKTSKT